MMVAVIANDQGVATEWWVYFLLLPPSCASTHFELG